MRKSSAFLSFLALLPLAAPAGAALIYQENFSSDGTGTRYTVTGGGQTGTQDYWRRSNGGFNPGFTGSSGTFWAGRDLDEAFGGGVVPRAVQQTASSAVSLAGYTAATMSILLAANTGVWDGSQIDSMRLYVVDYGNGGAATLLDTFLPISALDSNLRSGAYGTALGTAFVRYTYSLPVMIGNVGFRFEASSTGDLEYIGFDDIRFEGTPVPEPASAALLLLGFTLLGVARRRTR